MDFAIVIRCLKASSGRVFEQFGQIRDSFFSIYSKSTLNCSLQFWHVNPNLCMALSPFLVLGAATPVARL